MPETAPAKAAPEERPKNGKIILILPEKLMKQVLAPLRKKLLEQSINFEMGPEDTPPEKLSQFQWIIRFPWTIPPGKQSEPNAGTLLYRSPGMVLLREDKLPKQRNEQITQLLETFFALEKTVRAREASPEFVKLSSADNNLRMRQQETRDMRARMTDLNREIEVTEAAYYYGISYLFNTAIAQVTGVAVLQGIMKGLVRLMVIDNLGNRTIDGLVKLGFAKKFLTSMSTTQLAEKYNAFKQSSEEGINLTAQEFLFQSKEFENIDIVFFNNWDFAEDNFTVRVGLRKKTVLSKKEEQKKRQEQFLQDRKAEILQQIEETKEKLQPILTEIEVIEINNMEEQEKRYQMLLKQRKRILGQVQRHEARLKELERPVKASDEQLILSFDLFESFRSRQSFRDKLGDTFTGLGFGDLWKKSMGGDEQKSFVNLYRMAELSREYVQLEQRVNKMEASWKQLEEQLNKFSAHHGLVKKRLGARPNDPESYQIVLEEHLLERMQVAIMSCAIVNSFQEMREKAKAQQDTLELD
jgi:predicted nuclease with TOPRIM domain